MERVRRVIEGLGRSEGDRDESGRRSSDNGDDFPGLRPLSLADYMRSTVHHVEEPYDGLKVSDVDLMVYNNSVSHYTVEYNENLDDDESKSKFVVRRGFPFFIKISFTRPFEPEKDHLRFVFKTGKKPLPGNGTFVSLIPTKPESRATWGAEITELSEKQITVGIYTPIDCIVSKWNLEVQILEETGEYEIIHTSSEIFPLYVYILFNPWNPADVVYFDDERCRHEYILNEEGSIWIGDSSTKIDWYFKQFDKDILDCTLYLLDECYINMRNRGDAVLVSRALSNAGHNALRGNWSGKYGGGTKPTAWTGSAKILQEYYRTKSIVKYGQCWVFSGILTTMCRAVGIPCRSVTNFSSAHDTDGSITIDEYFTIRGDELDGRDSIWNFHVWNEVWMDRLDLPKEKKYGGWQALDCTPQELSDDRYQCGPMSVAAIKAGDVAFNYDGKFIFGEVNADRAIWLINSQGKSFLMELDKDWIGKDISTRALPKDDEEDSVREDLTHSYKYKEGTEEERFAVLAANLTSSNQVIYTVPEKKSVQFIIERVQNTYYGQDFVLKVRAKNKVVEKQSIYGYVTIKSIYYTGKIKETLKSERFEDTIESEKDFEVKVSDEDYKDKLADGCYISVVCCSITKETKQGSITKSWFRLMKPRLKLKVSTKEIDVNKPFSMKMEFTNPLKMTLTECEIGIEGSGIKVLMEEGLKQSDVGPKDIFVSEVKVKATKKGRKRITAVFNAEEIYDVSGTIYVTVK